MSGTRVRRQPMKIRVENYYSDGHESTFEEEVAEYPGDPDDPDELSDYLHEFTGDGHGAKYPKLSTFYQVTILESANPVLVGKVVDYG